jgi:hypothetical protein
MPFPPPTRTARGRVAAGAAAGVLVALLLGACTGSPTPTASPTPSATAAEPVFASDEEALAAAEESYERYLKVLNEIAASGNQEPERIRAVATETYAAEVESLFNDLTANGLVIEGETRFDSMKLLERFEEDEIARVVVLFCSDVSETRVLDSVGADVTPATRPSRSAMQGEFTSAGPGQSSLLPEDEDPWSGEYC